MTARDLRGRVPALFLAAGLMLAGCAGPGAPVQPLGQSSFAEYAGDTRRWIESRRPLLASNAAEAEAEIDGNAPFEKKPAHPNGGGILLIHGLGDSPWTWRDQADALAAGGWLVRTVLLPGCGTVPADMTGPSAADWRRVVDEQARLLKRDLEARWGERARIWLGGFSTGGNLALSYARSHDWIAGLVLFSPAVKIRTKLAFLAPLIAPFKTWLIDPGESKEGQRSLFRYENVPTPGLAAFYSTMTEAQDALEAGPYAKPVAAFLAAHDSVVLTSELLVDFDREFTHPSSRFFWYGPAPQAMAIPGAGSLSDRVVALPDALPQWRIASFSHMALTYRPDNPLYGFHGTLRICRTGQATALEEACRRHPEAVWFTSWGAPEDGRAHARLTFNPWFDVQEAAMLEVMRSSLPADQREKKPGTPDQPTGEP